MTKLIPIIAEVKQGEPVELIVGDKPDSTYSVLAKLKKSLLSGTPTEDAAFVASFVVSEITEGLKTQWQLTLDSATTEALEPDEYVTDVVINKDGSIYKILPTVRIIILERVTR